MLFATICPAQVEGLGKSPYLAILWVGLTVIAFICILWYMAQEKHAPWDEEDEDDQFYDI